MYKIELNYRIEGFSLLLNEDCILSRFYPLIPYKEQLLENAGKKGCRTKQDCAKLTDKELLQIGLPNSAMVMLFRAFLTLYDVPVQKLKEIRASAVDDDERDSLVELSLLPGVRLKRARLYFRAGYTNLQRIANALPDEMIASISEFMMRENVPGKAPLPKEVKTHIAVAKVLTMYRV